MKKKKRQWKPTKRQKQYWSPEAKQARAGEWYLDHTMNQRIIIDDYRDEKKSEDVERVEGRV